MELKDNKTEERKIIDDNNGESIMLTKKAQDYVGGMDENITFPNGDVLIATLRRPRLHESAIKSGTSKHYGDQHLRKDN